MRVSDVKHFCETKAQEAKNSKTQDESDLEKMLRLNEQLAFEEVITFIEEGA